VKCSNSSPGYTREEDFRASPVVTSLGDPANDKPTEVLSDPRRRTRCPLAGNNSGPSRCLPGHQYDRRFDHGADTMTATDLA
jgi:hypothetical protein